MPTVLRQNGFKVFIYTNDHEPAHVHVMKDRGEAKIQIVDLEEGPSFVSVSPGMKDKDAYRAFEIVVENQEKLLDEWKKYHG
jgi:hypothetical protein